MAHQHRSFTFPLSPGEDSTRTSPFEVRPDEIARLNASEGFRIIRKLLANQQKSTFCPHHHSLSKADEATWLLHRDITHALILPLLEIYRQAVQLSESLLHTRNTFDLELAFRGEARGAFSWLQCFIIEEEEWCSTRGCPACIVTHTLQSEPTIRLTLIACRLSPHLRPASLPAFSFWLSTLHAALDADPFWGPAHYADIASRAHALESGIQDLVRQCRDLAAASTPTAALPAPHHHPVSATPHRPSDLHATTTLRPSRMADRQLQLAREEHSWMQKILLGCWTALVADTAQAKARTRCERARPRLAGLRARSLTS